MAFNNSFQLIKRFLFVIITNKKEKITIFYDFDNTNQPYKNIESDWSFKYHTKIYFTKDKRKITKNKIKWKTFFILIFMYGYIFGFKSNKCISIISII